MIPDNVVEHGIGTHSRRKFEAEDDRLMPKARLYTTESEYDDNKRKRKHEKNNTESKRRKLDIDGELETPTQDLSLLVVDELARKGDGLMDEELMDEELTDEELIDEESMDEEQMGPSADLETCEDQS